MSAKLRRRISPENQGNKEWAVKVSTLVNENDYELGDTKVQTCPGVNS